MSIPQIRTEAIEAVGRKILMEYDPSLLSGQPCPDVYKRQIQDYALPFFARFSNLPKLLDDVEQEGFFPHRKGFDVPKRNREFIECFREYLQKQ